MFLQTVRVAVIDDNIEFGAGIKILLAKEEVEVYTASDGPEGLELVKQLAPDIVLLDIVMPGMDGVEVCKRIRKIPELMDVYIVMLSSIKTETGQMAEGLEAGADGYIVRPIPNRELLARLRAYIRMKRAEKTLQESEKRFLVAQEMSPDGFTILHPVPNEKGRIVDFTWVYENEAIARINGTDPQKVKGKRILDCFPDHRGTTVFETYLYVANTKKSRILEEIYVGDIISRPTWLRLVVFPMGDDIAILSQDITERKLAEEALRESEDRFRTIFEIASLGIAQVDPTNGKIILVNAYYETITGYRSEELNKMTFPELTHPDDREKDWEIFSKAARGEIEYRNEKRYIKKDGTIVWVRIHLAFIRDDKGNPKRTVAICEDITESKQAEEKLIKLSRAVEQSPVSIIITDSTGNIEYVNAKALTLAGYEFEELKGKNPRIFSSGEKSKEEYRTLWETILSGKEWRGEMLNKKKNGELYWEFASISAIKNQTGNITHFLAVKEDITERKQAEEKLKLLNRAIEASSVSVVVANPEGNIVYTNSWFTQITGYSSEEVYGRKLRILSPGKLSESDNEALWGAILSGKDWSGEYQNRKKNGEPYWEKAVVSPILNDKNEVVNFVAIKEDITYRKQAEETLKQLEIARKTARFKQDFLAKMSHEIRTPLAGLLGMMEVLMQTGLSEEQLQFMTDMKVSGENLKEIINMVLEYSKIEAGKVSLKPEIFEFKNLLDNAKTLFRDRLSAGVECIVDVDSNIPLFVKADKFRLSQVINNLVSNAVKFTQQGSITLRARLVKPDNAPNPILVKVEICDTGKGIPENMQAKLFKPFVQSEEGEIPSYEGTGLGLSICKELVELMQGEIGLESDEGKGSVFWFTFAAEKAEEMEHAQTQIHISDTIKNIRILFAEDMLVLQKVTRLLLKSAVHEVQLANNGQQVLELFVPGQFDLILMDINMPLMDGITATRLLREKFTHLPPIVGLSANAFEGDREKYLALGMDDYLVKPFNLADFNRLVSRLHKSN